MKQHPVEHSALRMTLAIYPGHGSRDDQKSCQDGGLRTYTPYKRPSLIQALFGEISTEVDVGRIVASTNVHYKLRAGMKNRIRH